MTRFTIKGEPKLPVISKPKEIEDVELLVYEDESKYPDGLYLFNWESFRNKKGKSLKLTISEMKTNLKEVLEKLKENHKSRLYFHPINPDIEIIAEKIGAIKEKDMPSYLGAPMMSISIGKLEMATKRK